MSPYSPQKHDKEHHRNMIVALILAGLVMFAWEIFYNMPMRQAREAAQAEQSRLKAEQLKNSPAAKADNFGGIDIEDSYNLSTDDIQIKQLPPRNEVLRQAPRVKINNGRIHGSISLKGARIDDVTLADYKQTIEKNSPEVILMSPAGSQDANFIELNWIAEKKSTKIPKPDTLWEIANGNILTENSPITLRWDNGEGLIFYITYSLDKNYMFSAEQSIENYGNDTLVFFPYGLISKSKIIDNGKAPLGILHTGAIGVINDKLEEVDYDDLREDKNYQYDESNGWIGITDKYWFKALLPQNNEKFKSNFRYSNASGTEKFQVDYLGEGKYLSPGQKISYSANIFAGAKELALLESYEEKYNARLFDRAIDFGFLYFLTKPLSHLLKFFYNLVGNFGIAIILLTFCVKLALFPIARKGYISMGRLKELGPKMKDLKDRNKDDKAGMNQALMQLYRDEKVNPASGCLPILLQIPIFFALYKVLFISLEMRHAPFFGWIQDLSAPDPTSFWNLFGLLPFDGPAFLTIGVWPIAMAFTMFLQQLVSPAPTDPMQAKVMRFLPLLFLFMFYSFPAGLIIYWTFSNLLTFSQQFYFTRRHPRDK